MFNFQNFTAMTTTTHFLNFIYDKNSIYKEFFSNQMVYILEVLSCLQIRRDTTYLSFIKLFESNVSDFRIFNNIFKN